MILAPRFAGRAIVRGQGPIRLTEYSQLQPDIALLRFRDDYYAETLPMPNDILFLVEVSDRTLASDLRVKVPLYAQNGISEVWVVDVQGETIEVYSQPERGAYQSSRQVRRGETLPVPGFPDVNLTVTDILG
jgi:Uma2 family endonuclease